MHPFVSFQRCAIAAMLLVFIGSTIAADLSAEICPICGNKMGQAIYRFTRRGRDEKVLVCANCAKLESVCYICALPVKRNFTRLADGRLLCEEDARGAIFVQEDAEKLFDDIKRDVQSILAQHGSLPHNNVRLVLEAKARLDKSGANIISAHDDRLLMGLTRTRSSGEDFDHTIYLLYGLTRERMMVVAAHEYTHAWLHENVRRKLNHDAEEGFCDWIAHKVIAQKNAPYETRVLLESQYSRGQLQAFIAAEKEHSFYRVMQWLKGGVDPEIEVENLARILELRADAARTPEPLAFSMGPVPARPAPTNLVLKGLSGSRTRRFAMVNDRTFEVNETGKVRLGTSNVVVRCISIGDDHAVVEVGGRQETLRLGNWR